MVLPPTPPATMPVQRTITTTTDRIIARSQPTRQVYLARLDAALIDGVQRNALSCTNLAHGFAAFPANDKLTLRQLRQPSVAIVSSYNDMLSAHQPFARRVPRDTGLLWPRLCDWMSQV